MNRLHGALCCLAISAVAWSPGCSSTPSGENVVDEFRPGYSKLVEKLRKVAAALPPVGELEEQPPATSLLSPLQFDDPANIASIMIEELIPQGAPPLVMITVDPESDDDFADTVRWMGQTDGDYPDDAELYREKLDWGESLSYVLIHRASRYQKPAATPDEEASEGIQVESVLVDMDTGKVLAAFTVVSDQNVSANPAKAKDPKVMQSNFEVAEELSQKIRDKISTFEESDDPATP